MPATSQQQQHKQEENLCRRLVRQCFQSNGSSERLAYYVVDEQQMSEWMNYWIRIELSKLNFGQIMEANQSLLRLQVGARSQEGRLRSEEERAFQLEKVAEL